MKTVKLGDVCQIVNGGTPKTDKEEYWDGDILWITPKDLGKLTDIYSKDTERKITQLGVNNSSAKIIPANSVIMSTRAPIGHLAINSEPMSFNQGCKGLVPCDKINVLYLYYFLKHSKKMLNDLGTGTTFPELSNKAFANVDIPLPSLEEQEKIVAKLDAAHSKIAEAELLMKQNIANVGLLQKSILAKYLDSANDTHTHRLGDLCSFVNGDRGKNYPSKSKQTTSGVPFINAGHLTDSGLDMAHMNYISQETYSKLGSGKIKPHDILYCLRGSLGKFASVGELQVGAIASSLVIVRPDETKLLNSYLLYYFGTDQAIAMIDKFRNGAAQPNLSARNLASYVISVPSRDEQIEIVSKLDELLAKVADLQRHYTIKLTKLVGLRQSLLAEAFAG